MMAVLVVFLGRKRVVVRQLRVVAVGELAVFVIAKGLTPFSGAKVFGIMKCVGLDPDAGARPSLLCAARGSPLSNVPGVLDGRCSGFRAGRVLREPR